MTPHWGRHLFDRKQSPSWCESPSGFIDDCPTRHIGQILCHCDRPEAKRWTPEEREEYGQALIRGREAALQEEQHG